MRGDMKAALNNMYSLKITERSGKEGTPTKTNQTHLHFRVCQIKCAHMSEALDGADAADVSWKRSALPCY